MTPPGGRGGGESGGSGSGAPVLHHERVTDDGEPARWLWVLHGIFGAGRNWRAVARRLAGSRPEWGVLLVDLRMHGQSGGFEPPHTLSACVRDLERLRGAAGRPPAALLGHSFGGKVALAALDEGALGGPGGRDARRQAWVVDSTPEASEPGGSAVRMLEAVRRTPGPFDSREEAADALVRRGFGRPVARWMTTNLERTDGRFRWARDWDAMEELLEDFFRRDLWDVVEDPPAGWEVRFLEAEDSAVSEETRERVERTAREGGRVEVHRLPGGHFLNADSPDEVADLLAGELP